MVFSFELKLLLTILLGAILLCFWSVIRPSQSSTAKVEIKHLLSISLITCTKVETSNNGITVIKILFLFPEYPPIESTTVVGCV